MQLLPISDISRAAATLPTMTSGFEHGLDFMQNVQKQNLLNKILGTQQQYAQPMAQAGLERANLANAIDQIKAKYMPGLTQSNIKSNLARAVLQEAQASKAPSEISLNLAQSKTLPTKTLANLINSLGTYAKAKQSTMPTYALSRLAQSPELLSLISTNPNIAKQVAQGFSNITSQATGQQSQGPGSSLFDSILSQGAKSLGVNVPSQTLTAGSQNQTHPMQLSDEDIMNMSKSASDVLSRKSNTAQIINQRQYAGILDNLFNKADLLMPYVVQYAGFAGKGKQGLDALKSSFGETSLEYKNYLYFTRNLAPILANEMRRTLGGQATDQEQKLMANVSNPNYWDSNPKQALDQFNFLYSVYKTSINPALANSPSETLANLKGTEVRPSGKQASESRSFNSVQDAVNANLPAGTIVLIGGRRARIKPGIK